MNGFNHATAMVKALAREGFSADAITPSGDYRYELAMLNPLAEKGRAVARQTGRGSRG